MTADFFATNRANLLTELKTGALVVVTGYGDMQRGNDVAHRFEQEANFRYLTGIAAPGWLLIMDGQNGSEWLVEPDLTDTQKLFDDTLDRASAIATSGVKTVIDSDEAMRRIRELTKRHSVVYTTETSKALYEHATFQFNESQLLLKKMLERMFDRVDSCNRQLTLLRAIKRSVEVEAIERAIKLTNQGLQIAQAMLPTVKFEYQLEAAVVAHVRSGGAEGLAWAPTIAAGPRTCTLHYSRNNGRLQSGQLVLFDLGARVDGYTADISRTYVKGKPTKRQVAVHSAVAEAQAECIALIQPGRSFDEYDRAVDRIMQRHLVNLGLSVDKYRDYFPHAIGHGLGIDVHDSLAGYDSFLPGMVMTVEPGIYIREESIGVRIEDDILVTDKGHKNLSGRLSTSLT